jgi:predicted Zn-dependent peptidase
MAIEYRSTTLANGLEVRAECDPNAQSAAVGIFVRTGTRDEPERLMGVSHFLEHMMFKGSATRSAHEVNEGFDRIGARNNAFTSHEMTAYHAHVLPRHLPEATSMIFDLLRPALRVSDFESERGVILEEIAMYEDNPSWVAYERANDAYYAGHPLGMRVLGTNATIKALGAEEMRAYFTDHYSPESSALVGAGSIDFDALVAQAEQESASWARASTRPTRAHPRHTPRRESLAVPQAKATRAYMILMWPSVAAAHPQRHAAAVCAQILGDTDGSRLHWALVEPGIAVDASAGYQGRDGTGEIVGSIVCATEDMVRAEEVLRKECAALRDSLTDDDLIRAANKIATGVAMAGESPATRMQRIGGLWALTLKYTSLEEELAKIQSLRLGDLKEHLTAFPFDPITRACVVPESN